MAFPRRRAPNNAHHLAQNNCKIQYMTKKLFIGAIIFFFLAAGTAVYLLFFYHLGKNTSNQTANTSSGYQPFPLGLNSQSSNTTPGTNTTNASSSPITIQTLTQLYTLPIAGAGVFSAKKSVDFVRLTDRATGHIYTISLATTSTTVTNELSDQTIPQIYRSLWINSSSTLLQYPNNTNTIIKTYSATLEKPPKTTATTSISNFVSITGAFLPDNIEAVVTNPASTKIFYLIESSSGVLGKIANINNNGATTIFSSAVSDWNVQWPNTNTIALSTKASSNVNGYLYFLSTKGTMQRILGDIPGLVTNVNPNTTLVAYTDSNPTLSIFNIKSGNTVSTGLNTIANKCTWSPIQTTTLYCAVPQNIPEGNYPDAWYQGLVSFSDDIYQIDANTGQAIEIGNISQQAGQPIDAENLKVSPDGNFLIFTNKIDLSLWALQIQ